MLSPVARVAAGAAVALTALSSLARALFYARLRRRHRANWEAMDAPNPFFHYLYFRRMTPLRRLVWGKGLADLSDRHLELLSHANLALSILAVLCLGVAAVDTWLLKQ
jgi:hypothetical protein